jgi:hypothetical protein
MGPKSCKSPNFGNFGTPAWESREKCHLDVGLVANHRVYYKGEGDGFPQIWAMVSLMSLNLPMARLTTQVLKLCTNQLVVWFVHVCVSN